MSCSECGGSGKCPKCGGTGEYSPDLFDAMGGPVAALLDAVTGSEGDYLPEDCPHCDGSGDCAICDGGGEE